MWDWIEKVHQLKSKGRRAVLATVVSTKGSVPREPGARMVVEEDGTLSGTIGGGRFEQAVIEDSLQQLSERVQFQKKNYALSASLGQCCGGSMEITMDSLNAGPKLYIYGAGHVGQALCRTLVGTPFEIHLVDSRAEWVEDASLPEEVHGHCLDWEQFNGEAKWDPDSVYFAIMTHDHTIDQEILADLLPRPAKYMGMMGSQTKWKKFRSRLEAKGSDPKILDGVHCPIGLKLGGKTPQEIAVSIAAELLKELHGL